MVMPLFIEEENSDAVTDWIAELAEPLIVSDLASAEFQSVMSRLVRMGKLNTGEAQNIRNEFATWRSTVTRVLENLPLDMRAAAELVQVPFPRLLSADAIHLATCRRLGLTLATLDLDLQAICERERVAWACPG